MNPEKGNVNTSNGITLGSVAFYTCNEGYILLGNSSRTCGVDGMWSFAPPTCNCELFGKKDVTIIISIHLVTCSDLPPLLNGAISYVKPAHNSLLTFPVGQHYTGTIAISRCLPGHEVVGESPERECDSNGAWDGTEIS